MGEMGAREVGGRGEGGREAATTASTARAATVDARGDAERRARGVDRMDTNARD
jgi:hypothetical protein